MDSQNRLFNYLLPARVKVELHSPRTAREKSGYQEEEKSILCHKLGRTVCDNLNGRLGDALSYSFEPSTQVDTAAVDLFIFTPTQLAALLDTVAVIQVPLDVKKYLHEIRKTRRPY